MQTTTGISTLPMAMNENPTGSLNRELFGAMMRKTRKTDWDAVIAKIDKQISSAGAVALALSILYFAPIFVSMLLR
jgi:hypothetical protein